MERSRTNARLTLALTRFPDDGSANFFALVIFQRKTHFTFHRRNVHRRNGGAELSHSVNSNIRTPACTLFIIHKITTKILLNIDIYDIPVRLLQSVGNISTSRITGFSEFIMIHISVKSAQTSFVKMSVNTGTCAVGKIAGRNA